MHKLMTEIHLVKAKQNTLKNNIHIYIYVQVKSLNTKLNFHTNCCFRSKKSGWNHFFNLTTSAKVSF